MDIREILKTNGIELVEGSHLDNVVQSLNEAASTLLTEWEPDFSAYDIDNLSGEDLDRIGGFFNIPRRPAIEAADFTGLNLRLKNISESETVSISNGFRVASENMTYKTTNMQAIDLGPGKWTTVPFMAEDVGTKGNAAIGEINRSLDDDNIEVYNLAPVVSGADIEDDASYRYRISKIRTLRVGGTLEAIDAILRTLPFISDVNVNRGRIPGTIEVYVTPVYGTLFTGLRDVINTILANYLAAGDVLLVHLPIYKLVKMNINIEVSEGRDFDTIASRVLEAAVSIILSYGSGSTFEIKAFTSELDDTLSGYPKLYRFIQVDSMVVYDLSEGGTLVNPIPVQKQYILGDNTLFTTNATYVNVS